MNAIDTVLVPIDFSDCAASVVQRASQLAAQVHARVVLMHAVDTPVGLSPDAIIEDDEGAPVRAGDHMRGAAESRMPDYLALARSEGVEATSTVAPGKPAEAILATADALSADLIVMGTHGRQGLKRMLIGSVAEAVVRRADAPVMTLRSQRVDSCEASSCGTCTSHVYRELDKARGEVDG
ncbi:MAG: universal stress protein [Deltaproteobacteria bacterium]|nr:universal stress protein [Deltaproteobacteria bacterium]